MTRKRFVKLLMAQGSSRNEANEWAADSKEGFTYSLLFAYYLAIKEDPQVIQKLIDNVIAGIKRLVEVLPNVINSSIDAIIQVCEQQRIGLEELNEQDTL